MAEKDDGWYLTMVLGVAAGLFLALLALRAHVLVHLWGWFVEPFGLPPLPLAHAAGLVVLRDALLRTVPAAEAKEKHTPMEHVVHRTLEHAFLWMLAWGLGAAIHTYMM